MTVAVVETSVGWFYRFVFGAQEFFVPCAANAVVETAKAEVIDGGDVYVSFIADAEEDAFDYRDACEAMGVPFIPMAECEV